MIPTFIDTSYLLAISISNDDLHERAKLWHRQVKGTLITTEYVLLEYLDALSAPEWRVMAAETIVKLRALNRLSIVAATTGLFNEGLAFFAKHEDKNWGITDCISFIEMRRAGATDALTADIHFQQAGFRALLRMAPV